MKPLNHILTVLLIALLCPVCLASEGVSFDVTVSSTEIEFDDTLTADLAITITGDESNFSIPQVPEPLCNGFTLLSTGSASMRSVVDGVPTVTNTTTYYFRPTRPGTLVMPAMSLDYADTRSGEMSTLSSARIEITVNPGSDGSTRTIGVVVIAAIVCCVIFITVIVYVRTQRKRRLEQSEDESVDPDQELLGQLRKAEIATAHGRLAEGQALLCDSVRNYIQIRFGATDRDLSEAEALVDIDMPNELRDMYIHLMSGEEKLKYGGTPKAEKEIQSIIDEIRHFLEQDSAN